MEKVTVDEIKKIELMIEALRPNWLRKRIL